MIGDTLDLFDFPKMEITKPIRLIELFGGIGSQAMALRDIEVANCIKARYDAGISNLQADGSGIIERTRQTV